MLHVDVDGRMTIAQSAACRSQNPGILEPQVEVYKAFLKEPRLVFTMRLHKNLFLGYAFLFCIATSHGTIHS